MVHNLVDTKRRPANNNTFIAILVGSWGETYLNMKSDLFVEFRIDITHHWKSDMSIQAIRDKQLPRDIELVLVIAEESKTFSKEVYEKARHAGVPFASISRRKSGWLPSLEAMGFHRFTTEDHKKMNQINVLSLPAPPSHAEIKVATPVMDSKGTGAGMAMAHVATLAVAATQGGPREGDNRYVKTVARKGLTTWTNAQTDTLVKLSGEVTESVVLTERYAAETGVYRLPGALHLHLTCLRYFSKASDALIESLRCDIIAMRKAKKIQEETQVKLLKKSTTDWPAWITRAIAVAYIGGVKSRLDGLAVYMDKQTGAEMFKTHEVLARKDSQAARLLGDGRRLNPAPRNTDEDLVSHIIETIINKPGMLAGKIGGGSQERVNAMLEKLVSEGLIKKLPHHTKPSLTVYAPAEWTEPTKASAPPSAVLVPAPASYGLPFPPAFSGEAPGEPTTSNPPPAVPHVLDAKERIRADIYARMAEGKLDLEKGMKMIEITYK